MSEVRPPEDEERAVEHRERKVVSEQPGRVASEEISRDAAAEQRMAVSKGAQVVLLLLGILEIILGLRFLLKLIAANPESGFTRFIETLSGPFVRPFESLVGTPTIGSSAIEITTLLAMLVYALAAWVIVRIIMLFANRARVRSVRSTEHRDLDDKDCVNCPA